LAVTAYGPDERRAGTVVVGVDLVPYHHTEHIAPPVSCSMFVRWGGVLSARSGQLRPVADMTTKVAEWSDHDLDQRFDSERPATN
jgi:hypothetical protein